MTREIDLDLEAAITNFRRECKSTPYGTVALAVKTHAGLVYDFAAKGTPDVTRTMTAKPRKGGK